MTYRTRTWDTPYFPTIAPLPLMFHDWVSRKIRRNQDLRLGAREAGVMAYFTVMDDEQKDQVDGGFDEIMDEFSDE